MWCAVVLRVTEDGCEVWTVGPCHDGVVGERVVFEHRYSPTDSELRRWAALDGEWEQDWDVIIAETVSPRLLMEILDDAERYRFDARCTIARALYTVSGNRARAWTHGYPEPMADLPGLVETARTFPDGPVMVWADRTEELLADPSLYDYERWCDGGLAQIDMAGRSPTS